MSLDSKRQEIVRYWWQKSKDSIASAKREINAKSLSFAMNRIYYAAFYAVSAVLLERKEKFKKHSGVRAAFHQYFIKTGLIEKKYGQFYDQVFEDRQEGDYIEMITFEYDYVMKQYQICTEFLKILHSHIKSLS